MKKTYYLDANRNFAEPSKAVWCVVTQYNKNGETVKETWIDLKQNKK